MSNNEIVKGKLFLILGPSGSGKGVLIKRLKEIFKDFVFPISCTTREMRPNERNGEVYWFISKDEFKKRMERGDFLEWAIVHKDNYYGTLKSEILNPLKEGVNVIREVDVQGVRSILELLPKENVATIFLTVKSWEELKERITRRHNISLDELAKRKESYENEMEFAKECKYVVNSITGELEKAAQEVKAIIEKETKID